MARASFPDPGEETVESLASKPELPLTASIPSAKYHFYSGIQKGKKKKDSCLPVFLDVVSLTPTPALPFTLLKLCTQM